MKLDNVVPTSRAQGFGTGFHEETTHHKASALMDCPYAEIAPKSVRSSVTNNE